MRKTLSIILTVTLILSLSTFTAFANNGNGANKGTDQQTTKEFKDMDGHWGYGAVQKIQAEGILEGYEDGTFRPEKPVKQEELAVILDRIRDKMGKDDDSSIKDDDEDGDEDSDTSEWAKDSVKKGIEEGYLNPKRFHSQVQCDRLIACVEIAKALGFESVDKLDSPFKDLGIDDDDFGYLMALYDSGYINGFPDGNFNPNKLLTRAQLAKIIEKMMEDGLLSDDDKAPYWDDEELTGKAISASKVELEWSGAKDNVGVIGYKVICENLDADKDATSDEAIKVKYFYTTSAAIKGLEAGDEYEFTVAARDAAGNWSDHNPDITITMKEDIDVDEDTNDDSDVDEDSSAPTWPHDAELTAKAGDSGEVILTWPDAKDDDGVKEYWIYKNGVKAPIKVVEEDSDDTNKTTITGLDDDHEYTFKVRAVDDDENRSDALEVEYPAE